MARQIFFSFCHIGPSQYVIKELHCSNHDWKLKEQGRQWHTSMNALAYEKEWNLKEIVAG